MIINSNQTTLKNALLYVNEPPRENDFHTLKKIKIKIEPCYHNQIKSSSHS